MVVSQLLADFRSAMVELLCSVPLRWCATIVTNTPAVCFLMVLFGLGRTTLASLSTPKPPKSTKPPKPPKSTKSAKTSGDILKVLRVYTWKLLFISPSKARSDRRKTKHRGITQHSIKTRTNIQNDNGNNTSSTVCCGVCLVPWVGICTLHERTKGG